MPRTKSTTQRSVEANLTVIDLVYLVAKNNGSMLSEKQLGDALFQNADSMAQAAKEAMMEVIRPVIFKLAGIQERTISDGTASPDEFEAITESDEAIGEVSATLTDHKRVRAGR